MNNGVHYKSIIRIQDNQASEQVDEIAEEYPLTIMLNGREFATMVCTPLDLEYLVMGFLASEGVVRSSKEVKDLTIDSDKGFAYVETEKKIEPDSSMEKRWIGSCCGKSRAFYFQSDAKTAKTVMNQFKVSPEACFSLMHEFHKEAKMFQRTGGVHQASLATDKGIEVTFNDIGRHNALDKLFGYMLINSWKKKHRIVIFSGRISSEVLLKVSKMGTGFLLSKSAPTDLALQLAEDLNITAAGFVRNTRMNIYTHPERVDVEVGKSCDELEGGVYVDGT